jgi:hypothetical protein
MVGVTNICLLFGVFFSRNGPILICVKVVHVKEKKE